MTHRDILSLPTRRSSDLLMAAAIFTLAGIGLIHDGTGPLWLTGVALAAYGFAGWGFNPPMNTRALQLAGDAGAEAVGLNTSALYVGSPAAAACGGGGGAAHGGRGGAARAAAMC